MAEGKTSMFGKTYNTIGSTDSNFIIKTKGDLKIQWGNKFIDLIKGGKITENSIFKKVNSEKDISNNGIYLVNDTIWIKIDDCKTPVSTVNSTTYVSFIEKQEPTPEQKQQALQNIGLFYGSLESVNSAGITSGIVYVQDTNKLYTINNGIISEYSTNIVSQENTDIVQCNTIQGDKFLKFLVGDFSYMVMQDLKISLHKNLVLDDNIQIMSKDANVDNGFRLYQGADKSMLEVDDIIWRDRIEPTFFGGEYLPTDILHTGWHNIVECIYDTDLQYDPFSDPGYMQHYTTLKLKYPKTQEEYDQDSEDQDTEEGQERIKERNIQVGDEVTILCNTDRVQYICVVNGELNNGFFRGTCQWVRPEEFIQFQKSIGDNKLEYPETEPFKIHNMYNKGGSELDTFYLNISYKYNNSLHTVNINLEEDQFEFSQMEDFPFDQATYVVSTGEYNVRVIFNGKSYYNLNFKPFHKITMPVSDVSGENNELITLVYDSRNSENLENGIFSVDMTKIPIIQLSRHLANSYIYKTNCKLLKNEKEGLILKDRSKLISEDPKIIDDTKHTIIGTVIEKELEGTLQDIQNKSKELIEEEKEWEKPQVGIYSDNLITVDSVLYDSVFKTLKDNFETKYPQYPQYDKKVKLPNKIGEEKSDQNKNILVDKKFNQVVPNIAWIKSMLDLYIPVGTIIMFNSMSEIPPGWAICNGENGTPDLRGRFIKASDEIGFNNPEGIIFEEGISKFKILEEHLPQHNHPHEEHTHTITGDTSSNITITSTEPFLQKSQNVKAASGNQIPVPNQTKTVESKITNYKFTGTTSSEKSEEANKDWDNKPFTIEPYSYSLIFIMKVKSFVDYFEEQE